MARRRNHALAATTVALLLVVLGAPAGAGTFEWLEGHAAPVMPPGDKVILDEEGARKVIETIRDAESRAAVIETQKAELAEKDRQILELKGALHAAVEENAKRDQAWALAEQRYTLQQENYDKLSLVITKQNELFDKTNALMDRQNAALTKAQERIEGLERRSFWQSILGPVVGGLLVFFGGGLLH